MKYEYILNKTDVSFDCSDYETYYGYQFNGFNIEIDKNDVINIESLEPFGDCVKMMENIKTLKDLKRFLIENFESIDDENKKIINELVYFINKNLIKSEGGKN